MQSDTRSRREIFDYLFSMRDEDLLAAILMCLQKRYARRSEMLTAMIAVMAIFGRHLPVEESTCAVNALRDLADQIERPLLKMTVVR